MPVVHPSTYQRKPVPRGKRRWPGLLIVLIIVVGIVNYARPLPAATASLALPHLPAATQPTIAWPNYGQAAIGADGYGVLATNGAQAPLATASIAKVITALSVLQKLPLQSGDTGPTYTINTADVAIYNSYQAQDGSAITVTAGEQLTEYQALQALLIPSANNIADSLVIWVFGSQAAYNTYATDYLREHGISTTHIGSDASGFDPSTTSTASDLTKLGLLAAGSPVLMQIAGQKQITLPVVGEVRNFNTVLGINGITGLKTGNNDADPGAFLFTAGLRIGTTPLTVDGTIMNAPDLQTALKNAEQLASSVQNGFEQVTIAPSGTQVGVLKAPWGESTRVITTKPLQLVRWKAQQLTESHQLQVGVSSGIIGTLQIQSGKTQVVSNLALSKPLVSPSFWWRLTRH